jgi:hypothetical protein
MVYYSTTRSNVKYCNFIGTVQYPAVYCCTRAREGFCDLYIYEGSKAKRNNFTRNCGLLVLYDETLYSLFLSRNAFTRLRTALISVEIYHINTK